MKLMIDGVWRSDIAPPPELAAQRAIHDGRFRHVVMPHRPSAFAAEAGRYHLYVSYACPFAHRTLVVHALKRLRDIVPISIVDPIWDTPDGWAFGASPLSTPDRAGNGFRFLHEAYRASHATYTGKVTVPVLWDTGTRQIVNNESIEIARMLNAAFDTVGADHGVDLDPPARKPEIDALSLRIAEKLSKGVYAVGQARDQGEYDLSMGSLFGFLDEMERFVGDGRMFLLGDQPTLADVLIFTPLVRFDGVYNPLFRASRKRLVDYPGLAALTRRLYGLPGVADTVRFDHILTHYYDGDWGVVSRRGITPEAPAIDFRTTP
ncbi:glutathione S-transferase C-terminal domain-containing protein [Reyranella sp. CPCC 100927]|uniref:glutathione S-transferase C-terminal domain-containing protein n=1 Tax=Reyranella sp. CPCC 100927 TaxID=2599616 RepID=UPI0011B72C79|nr:glutathione S-transferase C-terminal domain-containing protein [Reyranella sp. CPCC 100927]TWS97328.1 glutathione S-transferase family protein [Reyranella sp. CPCC 100927]